METPPQIESTENITVAGIVEEAIDEKLVAAIAERKQGMGRWADVVTEAADTVASIDLERMGFFDALRLSGQADQINSVEQVFELKLSLASNVDLARLRTELGEKRALLEKANAGTQARFVEIFKTSLKVFLEVLL